MAGHSQAANAKDKGGGGGLPALKTSRCTEKAAPRDQTYFILLSSGLELSLPPLKKEGGKLL